MHASDPPIKPSTPFCPQAAAVQSLTEDITRLLRLTRALVQAGRDVDLCGLDRQIGLLCAKTLDLETRKGRMFRPSLIELRREVDALTGSFATRNSPNRND